MTTEDFKTKLDVRIARRLFESAFEACDRLPNGDREQLLKDIAKRIVESVGEGESQRAAGIVDIRVDEVAKTVGIVGIEIE
jgi:hypothetical protein